jgi:hypothetical protein
LDGSEQHERAVWQDRIAIDTSEPHELRAPYRKSEPGVARVPVKEKRAVVYECADRQERVIFTGRCMDAQEAKPP